MTADMKKEELLRLLGSMEQVAGVRPVTYEDGRASGLRCAQVKNGPLEFSLMLDKCLDPAFITYKGVNLTFLTKPGLQGRGSQDTAGAEAIRSIMGGAMFTCGLDHVHGFLSIDGRAYPTHGRMRTTPAEKVGMDAFFDGNHYRIRVTGEMRQAALFGENMVLRRTVETHYGSREILFRDEIENQGFHQEPLCFLYHCNAGYPLLAPGSRFLLPSLECVPRDKDAELGMEDRYVMGGPADGIKEEVYLYSPASDQDGWTFGAVVNDQLKLGLCIRWRVRQIPFAAQWKSCQSGDYAMAVEPTNAGFEGRAGRVQMLAPMGKHVNELKICVLDGGEEIRLLDEEMRALEKGKYR